MGRGRTVRAGLAATLAAWVWCAVAIAAETPIAVVTDFSEALVGVIRNAAALGHRGRADRLRAAIARDFDLEAMAREIVGGAWDDMTPETRGRLVSALGRSIAADYASLFDRDEGQRLVVLPETVQRRDGVLVETRLLISDDDPIARNYLVRRGVGGWRIVDVLLIGTASEQATRRAEFSTLLGRHGIEGLIGILDRLAGEAVRAR